MIVKLPRRSCVPMPQISIPSIIMFPCEGSTNRKNDSANVDFPLPVLPTTPIFSRGLTENVSPFNTGSKPGA